MRDKILEAMYESVAKQGYDKTSLSQVAKAVSIQKPSLYYYFKSKEEIFLATIQRFYGDLFHIDLDSLHPDHSPQDLQAFFYQQGLDYLKPFQEDSTMQQFYCEVNLQSLRLPTLIAYFEENDQATQEKLREFFRFAQEKKAISRDIHLETQVNTTLALMIGLSEMILYHMKGDFQAVWKHYCHSLFLDVPQV